MPRQVGRRAMTPVPSASSSGRGGGGGPSSAPAGKTSTGRRRDRFQHRREGTGRKTSAGSFSFRGRRSGFKVKKKVKRDSDGFENVDDFWSDDNKEAKTDVLPNAVEDEKQSTEENVIDKSVSSARKSPKTVVATASSVKVTRSSKKSVTPHLAANSPSVKEKLSSIKKRRLTFEVDAEEFRNDSAKKKLAKELSDEPENTADTQPNPVQYDDEDAHMLSSEDEAPPPIFYSDSEKESDSSEDEDEKRRAGHTDDDNDDSSSSEGEVEEPVEESPNPALKNSNKKPPRRSSLSKAKQNLKSYISTSESEDEEPVRVKTELKTSASKRRKRNQEEDEEYSEEEESGSGSSDSGSEYSRASPKKPRRVRKVIPPAAVPDEDDATPGLRRSKRRRWKPLQHWKGERLILQQSKHGDGMVVDEIAEVIAAERPELFMSPIERKQRPRTKRQIRPAQGGPRVKPGIPKLDFVPDDPSTKLECLDVVSGTMVEKYVIKPAEDLYYQELPAWEDENGEILHTSAKAASAFDDSQLISGTIILPPLGAKAPESTHRFTQVFNVTEGQRRSLEVAIEENRFIASPGDQILIPAHVTYSFRNISPDTEVGLSFVLVKPSVSHATPASAKQPGNEDTS